MKFFRNALELGMTSFAIMRLFVYTFFSLLTLFVALVQKLWILIALSVMLGLCTITMILIIESFAAGASSWTMSKVISSRRDNTASNITLYLIFTFGISVMRISKRFNEISLSRFSTEAAIKDEAKEVIAEIEKEVPKVEMDFIRALPIVSKEEVFLKKEGKIALEGSAAIEGPVAGSETITAEEEEEFFTSRSSDEEEVDGFFQDAREESDE